MTLVRRPSIEAPAAPTIFGSPVPQIGLAVIYEFEGKREEAAPIGDRFFPVLEKAYFL